MFNIGLDERCIKDEKTLNLLLKIFFFVMVTLNPAIDVHRGDNGAILVVSKHSGFIFKFTGKEQGS